MLAACAAPERPPAAEPATARPVTGVGCGDLPPAPVEYEDGCAPREVTGEPPCELVCTRTETGPLPSLRTIGTETLLVLSPSGWRAVFTWRTYDGPLDPVSLEDAQAHTLSHHWDDRTVPPTLVLPSERRQWRDGSFRVVGD